MITVERTLPVGAHPEETARERLTFSMPPRVIDQVRDANLFFFTRLAVGILLNPTILSLLYRDSGHR